MDKLNKPRRVICAWASDDYERNLGSSGGVFGLIAKAFIRSGGVVIGAKFDDQFNVKHAIAHDDMEVIDFYKSKYVESDIKEAFSEAEILLRGGAKVLFSGTPCQVYAFKNRFSQFAEQIFAIDIVCHGTPESNVWKKYVEHLEWKYSSKIIKVDHRKKDEYSWGEKKIEIKFADGDLYISDKMTDPYMQLFLDDVTLTKKCYTCKFSSVDRSGDLTIGDNWGLLNDESIKGKEKGLSLVIVGSEKGEYLLSECLNKLEIVHKPIDISYIREFSLPPIRPVYSDDFCFCMKEYGMKNALLFYSYVKDRYFENEKKRFNRIIDLLNEVDELRELGDSFGKHGIKQPYIYGCGAMGKELMSRLGKDYYFAFVDKRDIEYNGEKSTSLEKIKGDNRAIILTPTTGIRNIINELSDNEIDRARVMSLHKIIFEYFWDNNSNFPIGNRRQENVLTIFSEGDFEKTKMELQLIHELFPNARIWSISDTDMGLEEMKSVPVLSINYMEMYTLLYEMKDQIDCLVDLAEWGDCNVNKIELMMRGLINRMLIGRKQTFVAGEKGNLIKIDEKRYHSLIAKKIGE